MINGMPWYLFYDKTEALVAEAAFRDDAAAEMYAKSLLDVAEGPIKYYREVGKVEKP